MSLISVYVIAWIALFVCASLIDLKYFILPDWITLPLIVSGVLFNILSESRFCSSTDCLLGIVVGYCLIRLVDEVYFKFKKLSSTLQPHRANARQRRAARRECDTGANVQKYPTIR